MDTESGFRPPYMSFQTFWNYVEELAEKPLPPRIDRSIMKSKSGTDQANLVMAFSSFGLTSNDGKVQGALTELVEATSPEDRPAVFGELVRKHYAGPLRVSAENGTPADLTKVFTDDYPSIASGDTRRKAVTFFLHAARKAGIELSPHFPTTRSGQGAPGAPRAKRPARKRVSDGAGAGAGAGADTGNGTQREQQTTPGYSRTVELRSGGTVTLAWNVNMAFSSDEDEDFVLSLVRKLRSYESGSDPASGGGAS